MNHFLLTFIPLFVAIDPFGTFPLFISLTEGYTFQEKKRLALEAVFTALIIGTLFAIGGRYIFNVLGITSADFRIAGGLLLLVLSFKEIFGDTTKRTVGQTADKFVGVVPLGIPLIAGPAMITTLLILYDTYGYVAIMVALISNLIITFFLYIFADRIVQRLGEATSRALAKLIGIFLAAIAIMMIRKGIMAFIQ